MITPLSPIPFLFKSMPAVKLLSLVSYRKPKHCRKTLEKVQPCMAVVYTTLLSYD